MWTVFAVSSEHLKDPDCPENLLELNVHEYISIADIIDGCGDPNEAMTAARKYAQDCDCVWLEDGTLQKHIRITRDMETWEKEPNFGA